ncbi:hypothetical protein [Haliea sp.]
MTEFDPGSAKRRSPVYRQFVGAEYCLVAGQPQAFSIKGAAQATALYDFTLMPRFGVRGADAVSYLRDRQFSHPDAVNRTEASDDGSWVARLGKTEYWVLGATSGSAYPDRMHGLAEPGSDCYPVPCDEGRLWFVLHSPQKTAVVASANYLLLALDDEFKEFDAGIAGLGQILEF